MAEVKRGQVLFGLAGVLLAFLAVACGGEGSVAVGPTVVVPPDGPSESPAAQPTGAPATSFPVPDDVPEVQRPQIESLESLGTDVDVPELAQSFAPPVPDAGLLSVIRGALQGFEGEYSVVVRNLEDGRSASLNEGRVYYAASLFKLELLLEAYRQRDAGDIDFAELLTLTEEYAAYDLNTLKYLELEVGDQLTLGDAVKAMIIVSDTPCAVMVQDKVQPQRVNETLRSLGIESTSVTEGLPATAADMARLMEAVAAGEGVTAESRRQMLALLLQEWYREGIPAGVPDGVAVAHKTGNVTDASHDVALVWGPAGPYVLAVLSDRSWESAPLAAVSRAVWDYFSKHP